MKILFFFINGFFFLSPLFSQSVNKDPLSGIQVKNGIDLYNRYTDGNAPIFNGEEYIYYSFKKDGDPFFLTGEFTTSWIGYEGRVYDPVSLFYDIVRDQLVILNADSLSRIILHNEFVDSFSLLGHTFISLAEDHKQNLYNTGFYDRLYNGQVQLFARRIKLMTDVIEDHTVVWVFSPKDRFYIHKDGLYYLVNNQKDVFRLFSDKKREVRRLMRKAHLKFRRKNFENTLIGVIAFYDQLLH